MDAPPPKIDLSGWERVPVQPADILMYKKPTEAQPERVLFGIRFGAEPIGFDGLLCAYSPGLFKNAAEARAWASGGMRVLSIESSTGRHTAVLQHARSADGSIYCATVATESGWRLELNCPEFGQINLKELGRVGLREMSLIRRFLLADRMGPPSAQSHFDALRNRCEEWRWDEEFPASPLSRLRRHIEELTSTL